MNTENTAGKVASSAVQLLPTLIASVNQISNDVDASQKDHATVIHTASAIGNDVITSLNAVAASGAVGHNDAANIEEGTTAAQAALDLIPEAESFFGKLEALGLEIEGWFTHPKVIQPAPVEPPATV